MNRSPAEVLEACRPKITPLLTPTCKRRKPDASWVTNTDLEVERVLLDHIRERFPSDAILAEETARSMDASMLTGFCWVIDPIDGTEPLLAGSDSYSVSVGLVEAGRIIDGAVWFPGLEVMARAPNSAVADADLESGAPDVYISSCYSALAGDPSFLPGVSVRSIRSATFCLLEVIERRASAYLLGEAALWDICAMVHVAAHRGVDIYVGCERWDPRRESLQAVLFDGYRTQPLLATWRPRADIPSTLWTSMVDRRR